LNYGDWKAMKLGMYAISHSEVDVLGPERGFGRKMVIV
jgi:hypothetical protein